MENTVHEIHQLLLAPVGKIDKKTFYIADKPPVDLYEFANGIRKELGARKIRHVPLWIAKSSARIGDFLKPLGWRGVPLTSFRLNNILTGYVFDLQPIMGIAAPLPYGLKTGISRTIQWMREKKEL